MKTEFKKDVLCTARRNKEGKKGNDDKRGKTMLTREMIIGLISGAVILVVIVVIIVIVLVWSKKKRQKKNQEAQADVNPVYDGAADYEYDDMGNYDSMEVSTRKKKELKAEVVDRSSIYGEKEEGWEDAVVVDENPNYES